MTGQIDELEFCGQPRFRWFCPLCDVQRVLSTEEKALAGIHRHYDTKRHRDQLEFYREGRRTGFLI